MKKALVLAAALATGVAASAYAANPFSDVPQGHWAYGSIAKLASSGVVEGYGDGTFRGGRMMTRYEMAQIVARAMAQGETGAEIDKLSAEFADELDNLGVRVARLEKRSDNVKITGEARYRFWRHDRSAGKSEEQKLRSRIWFKGSVNDDWTYTGMIENTQDLKNDTADDDVDFQRAWVNGRVGGLKVQAGRYHYVDAFEGMIYADRMDGLQVSYGKEVKLTLGLGKGWDKHTASNNAEDMYYAELTGKIGLFDARAGYYKFEDMYELGGDGYESKIWAVGLGLPILVDGLKLTGAYFRSDYDDNGCDDDGYYITLKYKGAKASKANTWGVWASYYDFGIGTTVAGTVAIDANKIATDFSPDTDGWKGYGVGANYAFAKNIVGAVKYFDLEGKKGDVDSETLYSELIFTF